MTSKEKENSVGDYTHKDTYVQVSSVVWFSQSYVLFPYLRVHDDLIFAEGVRRMKPRFSSHQVWWWLELGIAQGSTIIRSIFHKPCRSCL